MNINIHKEVEIEPTIRTELLSSMFEVPARTKLAVTLTGELEISEKPWNIGLIVGPSGSGKTLLLNELFSTPRRLEWKAKSVIDDFPSVLSMEDISRVCQSVGFNTIPSWLRPYNVLSNGERFRVETARYLLDDSGIITIDEFTSVVDRQVAQFACHAIQKYLRERGKRLVVASCHYDIINWLQPDWLLEPGNPCRFTWRSLQRRPPINVSVSRVKYETWKLFRDFHYMSADLNRAARCYGLFVQPDNVDQLSGILGLRHKQTNIHEQILGESSSCSGNSFSRIHSSESNSFGGSEGGVNRSPSSETRTGDYQSDSSENPPTGDDATTTDRPGYVKENSPHAEDVHSSKPVGRRLDKPDLYPYRIASMCGVLYRPHPKVSDIVGFTRMVTLPDFQGLGLAFVLASKVASAYKALGKRLHSYPNHPAWIRSYQRSKDWMQVKEAGVFSPSRGKTSSVGGFGGRRCAVFLYIGDAMNREDAIKLVGGE